MAYAGSADVEARWRPLSPTEHTKAEVLCADASALIDDMFPNPTASDESLTAIVCAMVKRAMISGVNGDGVTAQMDVSGPFTQQQSFSNPTGNLYLTKDEKRRLGKRQVAFVIPGYTEPTDDE